PCNSRTCSSNFFLTCTQTSETTCATHLQAQLKPYYVAWSPQLLCSRRPKSKHRNGGKADRLANVFLCFIERSCTMVFVFALEPSTAVCSVVAVSTLAGGGGCCRGTVGVAEGENAGRGCATLRVRPAAAARERNPRGHLSPPRNREHPARTAPPTTTTTPIVTRETTALPPRPPPSATTRLHSGVIQRGCVSTRRTRSTFVVEGWLMHRGGGVAGSGAAGGAAGIAGGSAGSSALPSTSHRGLELEHPSAMPGAPGFHWGAMLAGHHAAAAASMMQPPLSAAGEYTPAPAHHGPTHPAMPMDLHVHQGFPYYRLV
ncbi:unnamed protein product, partial [Heterotrigona itama]